jgi:hypothetical protein
VSTDPLNSETVLDRPSPQRRVGSTRRQSEPTTAQCAASRPEEHEANVDLVALFACELERRRTVKVDDRDHPRVWSDGDVAQLPDVPELRRPAASQRRVATVHRLRTRRLTEIVAGATALVACALWLVFSQQAQHGDVGSVRAGLGAATSPLGRLPSRQQSVAPRTRATKPKAPRPKTASLGRRRAERGKHDARRVKRSRRPRPGRIVVVRMPVVPSPPSRPRTVAPRTTTSSTPAAGRSSTGEFLP